MTAGAVGLVSRGLPDNDFGIVLVAPGAVEISPVIEWFISQGGMPEAVWRPRHRIVTGDAILSGNKVTVVFSGCRGAVVAT